MSLGWSEGGVPPHPTTPLARKPLAHTCALRALEASHAGRWGERRRGTPTRRGGMVGAGIPSGPRDGRARDGLPSPRVAARRRRRGARRIAVVTREA